MFVAINAHSQPVHYCPLTQRTYDTMEEGHELQTDLSFTLDSTQEIYVKKQVSKHTQAFLV